MTHTANASGTPCLTGAPRKLLKRIGSTTYEVSIHFSESATETLGDKVARLIGWEASRIA